MLQVADFRLHVLLLSHPSALTPTIAHPNPNLNLNQLQPQLQPQSQPNPNPTPPQYQSPTHLPQWCSSSQPHLHRGAAAQDAAQLLAKLEYNVAAKLLALMDAPDAAGLAWHGSTRGVGVEALPRHIGGFIVAERKRMKPMKLVVESVDGSYSGISRVIVMMNMFHDDDSLANQSPLPSCPGQRHSSGRNWSMTRRLKSWPSSRWERARAGGVQLVVSSQW